MAHTAAIMLAAGKGTRMNSDGDLPKVLEKVCERPMLAYVIDACRQAGCDRLIAVVGHQAQKVRDAFASDRDISWVEQRPQQGTGHAVMVCKEQLAALDGPVLVVAGDGPLIQGPTLQKLLQTHVREQAACTLATCILPDAGRYGRILRNDAGELDGIVEYLDATESQRAIREVNVSLYCFDAESLRQVLPRLTNDNKKGEYYLTDTLSLLRAMNKKVAAVCAVPPADVLSINTPGELAEVERILRQRQGARGGVG